MVALLHVLLRQVAPGYPSQAVASESQCKVPVRFLSQDIPRETLRRFDVASQSLHEGARMIFRGVGARQADEG